MDRRPSSQDRQREDRRADGITVGLAFIIVLGAIAIYFFVTATPDRPAFAPTISSNPLECEQVIALEKLTGLVKRHPSPARLDVDEALWTGMATEQKRIVLDHLACAAFGGRSLAQLGPGEDVTVYGSASGRLLSRAGAKGIVSR